MYYIGIDLGTSAVKLLLMDETGNIANIVSREYPIAFPHPGWSEQDPADWWAAVCDGIPALLDGFDASQVKGIGAGGQMHGLVVLDSCRIRRESPVQGVGQVCGRLFTLSQRIVWPAGGGPMGGACAWTSPASHSRAREAAIPRRANEACMAGPLGQYETIVNTTAGRCRPLLRGIGDQSREDCA